MGQYSMPKCGIAPPPHQIWAGCAREGSWIQRDPGAHAGVSIFSIFTSLRAGPPGPAFLIQSQHVSTLGRASRAAWSASGPAAAGAVIPISNGLLAEVGWSRTCLTTMSHVQRRSGAERSCGLHHLNMVSRFKAVPGKVRMVAPNDGISMTVLAKGFYSGLLPDKLSIRFCMNKGVPTNTLKQPDTRTAHRARGRNKKHKAVVGSRGHAVVSDRCRKGAQGSQPWRWPLHARCGRGGVRLWIAAVRFQPLMYGRASAAAVRATPRYGKGMLGRRGRE